MNISNFEEYLKLKNEFIEARSNFYEKYKPLFDYEDILREEVSRISNLCFGHRYEIDSLKKNIIIKIYTHDNNGDLLVNKYEIPVDDIFKIKTIEKLLDYKMD